MKSVNLGGGKVIVDAPAQPNTPSYALRQQSPAHAAPHERPKPWATVRTSGHEEQRGSTADSTCGVHQAASRTRVKFRPQRTENSRQWLARRDTVAMKITSRGHRTRPAHNSCPQDPVAVLACTHAKTPCHCVRIREAGRGRTFLSVERRNGEKRSFRMDLKVRPIDRRSPRIAAHRALVTRCRTSHLITSGAAETGAVRDTSTA